MRSNLASKWEAELQFREEGIKAGFLGGIVVLWYKTAVFWYEVFNKKRLNLKIQPLIS